MKEAIKDKITKIIEEEIEEIECSPCEAGEDEFSHNIRKMHYKAEAKALKIRLRDAFAPKLVTAIYLPADDNGPEQNYYECPACHSNITDIDDKDAWQNRFCRACGQPLDWSGLGFDTSLGKNIKIRTNHDYIKQNIQARANHLKNMPADDYAKYFYYRMELPVNECPLYGKCATRCNKSDAISCIKAITRFLKEKI
ncbi:MAG: hypothetical protein IJT36_01535 [Alphaproteobacteria bacterium]|nr:hypothetical protein [Alphaproteobacteria bacterium]